MSSRARNYIKSVIKHSLPFALICLSHQASAQYFEIDKGPYPFQFTERSYEFLRNPDMRRTPLDRIHYIPLNITNESFVSFGGTIREDGWTYQNSRHGFPTAPQNMHDTLLNSRMLLDAFIHIDEHLDGLVEFGSFYSPGRNQPYGSSDVASARIQQGFVDIKEKIGTANVSARLGRQEFFFGSGTFFWIANRQNIPRSWDGALLDVKSEGNRFQFFTGQETAPAFDPFVEHTHPSDVTGTHITTPILEKTLSVDEYYYHIHRRNQTYGGVSKATEFGDLIGIRPNGQVGNFKYDADVGYKFGTLGSNRISAVGAMVNTSYMFKDVDLQPILGLQFGYFSGNNGYNTHTISTFVAPYPRAATLNYAGHNALTNLIETTPSLIINPSKEVAFRIAGQFLWRASVHDYVYYPTSTALTATKNNTARYIGTNLLASASWLINPNTKLFFEYLHEFAGPAITLAGGRGSDIGVLQLEFNF